jgi:hypothetical protein
MSRHKINIFISAILFYAIGFMSALYIEDPGRGVPLVGQTVQWSIGIYTGDSPLHLTSPANGNMPSASAPVLTAQDVRDVPAAFVADPFMVYENHSWYMFFEVLNKSKHKGEIGLATSEDGLKWAYKQIILDEPFHLSFPYVFKWQGEYYMIPESTRAWSIRLYKAVNFPTGWSYMGTLLKGPYVDSTIFRFHDKWWLLTCSRPNDTLSLYYADELLGPWIEHPKNPVIEGNAHIARPGGRVVIIDGRLIRYAQDDEPFYGKQVRAFEITELTTTSYEEIELPESPILKGSGSGWNAKGMHTADPHPIGDGRWISTVDGQRDVMVFGMRY